MYRIHDQRRNRPFTKASQHPNRAGSLAASRELGQRSGGRRTLRAATARGVETTSRLVALAALAAAACSSNKNYELRESYAESLDDDDRDNCVNPQTCTPDPGPKPLSAEECERITAGYEYLPVWDYEGNALFTFQYDDLTTYNKVPTGWEPNTEEIFRCGGLTGAYHTYGGPFIAWGGGFGGRLENVHTSLCDADPDHDACSDVVYDVLDYDGNPTYPDSDPGIRPLDLSEWDGISFWARRGPDSQTAIRVWLADTNVDEDIAFARYTVDPEAPRTCERLRLCGCRNHTQCTEWKGGPLPIRDQNHVATGQSPELPNGWQDVTYMGEFTEDYPYYFCWDPETDGEPIAFGAHYKYLATINDKGVEERHPWCGRTVCEFMSEFSQSWDPQFNGRPCTEYTFRTGLKDSYCFDPKTDPPPPPTDQECGDGWMKSVPLSTDWQFYRVPFTELLQQGWAKEFHELKLEEVSALRFTFNRGYIDYWIDDVAFYRKAD